MSSSRCSQISVRFVNSVHTWTGVVGTKEALIKLRGWNFLKSGQVFRKSRGPQTFNEKRVYTLV